ncbi:hypothetical protein [Mesorhizobium kowhaii]|uniref:Uncharacterized protein n=1 Tax=Mesorhizobium kowhaii TaxID=1300272 RepID=A0A2W7C3N0_9HYPH|nr:hypothetical protein [Mesorhizobium kowhaii]PZV37477.1 hypothetical protein B5V02_14350 [Mesorhizobium kowhaii]
MTDMNELLATAEKSIRAAIEAAYKSGFDEGKKLGEREAAAGFKSRLASLFVDDEADTAHSSTKINELFTNSGDSPATGDAERATPGTVKPAILDVVAKANRGISTKDIARATNFKYNSVRGTLWTLRKEHAIEKNENGKWVAASAIHKEAKQAELDEYEAARSAAKDQPPSGGNENSGSNEETAA